MTVQQYILLYLKGVSMGIAGIIPGVSGGTIAFITGIYEELVMSIDAIDSKALRTLSKFQFKSFWERINGNFLGVVFAGISTSFLLLSNLILYLQKVHPILIRSFFLGLVAMCFPLILRKINKWSMGTVAGFLIGTITAYLITISSPIETSENIFLIFLTGSIAICAMVMPGISGVFILLLLGKYQYIAASFKEGNVLVMIVFIIGCILGLIGISRLLARMLESHHQIVIAILSGFMVGALNKVWPWRQVLEYATNSKGDQIAVFDKSVLPWHFLSTTGKDPQLFQAIFMMALGILIVVFIEKIAVRLKTKH